MAPVELDRSTRLAVPNGTSMADHDGAVVLTGVFGTKTLSGDSAPIAAAILDASDGETPLRDIDGADDATLAAVAELLVADGLAYPAAWLAGFDVDAAHRGLLESLLLAVDITARPSFAETVSELAITVRGDPMLASALRAPLSAIGCDLDGSDPDVVLFGETPATDERAAVNDAWLETDATLVRTSLDGTTLELGPVLSASSAGCLDCLTAREAQNGAQTALSYRTLTEDPPYATRLCSQLVTELALRAGLDLVPSSLAGRMLRFDTVSFEQHSVRLLAVPGCDHCGDRY